VIEVNERVRPLNRYDSADLETVEGSNKDKYVVVTKMDLEQVETDLIKLKSETDIDSIAVVLMHSYSYTANEESIGLIAKKLGFK
jgi:5-oxoprolinase (ATP-hydrolysing)